MEFSAEVPDQFHLYRVFQFGKPKRGFYSLTGSLRNTATLDPVVYQGRPREDQYEERRCEPPDVHALSGQDHQCRTAPDLHDPRRKDHEVRVQR